MILAKYLIVLLTIYLIIINILLNNNSNNNSNKKVKLFFKLNNQIMESKIKLTEKQKVSIVSVDSNGVEQKVNFSELSLVSVNNTEVCTIEQDGDDFIIVPHLQGKTQIIVQFVSGLDTLTESLDVIVGEDSKIVSIKFVLGDLITV